MRKKIANLEFPHNPAKLDDFIPPELPFREVMLVSL